MKTLDYLAGVDGGERRFFSAPIEMRAASEGMDVEGVAAVVNSATDMGWYMEEIAPGAFDERLNDDVRALFNHDANQILARTNAGTLKLFITNEGHLGYRFRMPDRSYAKDLADAIRSGDVSQSSFGFTISDEEWLRRDAKDVRRITKVKRLFDVSPVTFPAYADTTVAKRSYSATLKQSPGLYVRALDLIRLKF
jgi:HK97 family phage prohead protease